MDCLSWAEAEVRHQIRIYAKVIAEAALRSNLNLVRVETEKQLDLQARHRVRSRLVSTLLMMLSVSVEIQLLPFCGKISVSGYAVWAAASLVDRLNSMSSIHIRCKMTARVAHCDA